MDSTMTLTQWEVDNSKRESAKPAKLSQEKVHNLDNQRKKFYINSASMSAENVDKLNTVGFHNKEFLDKFNMTLINNGHVIVKLNSGRKLKVKHVVKDGTKKCYVEAIEDGLAIETTMPQTSVSVTSEPVVQQTESNIREFPSRTTLYTQETTSKENMVKEVREPANNMYSFETGKLMTGTRSEANNENNMPNTNSFAVNNIANTLSRTNRMDYNIGAVNNVEKQDVVARDNTVSIDDYLQHGKIKNSSRDLEMLMQNNERLSSEIDESQRVLEQLEAQLTKLKEISEAKRQARINELEEENLSKTATLNGLTEQIKALQEAIRLEQQNANEGTMRRIA